MNSISILVTGVLALLLNMSGENVLEEGFTDTDYSYLIGTYDFVDGTSITLVADEFDITEDKMCITINI